MKKKLNYLILLVALLVVFLPVVLAGDTFLIGAPDGDVYKHSWGHWWVRYRIFEKGELPFSQDLLYFPLGGDFYCLDTFHSLLSSPFAWLGTVRAYNLNLCMHLLIAAGGIRKLAEALGLSQQKTWIPAALSLICGWVYSFPMSSGVSEHMGYSLCPWVGWALLSAFKNRHIRYPIYFSTLLIIQALLSWGFAIISGIASALFLLGWLFYKPWKPGEAPWRFNNGILKRAGVSFVALFLPAVLFYLFIFSISTGENAVYQRTLSLFPTHAPWATPQTNSFSLLHFFAPLSWGSREVFSGVEVLRYTAYPGYVLMGGGLWAAWKGGRVARLLIGGALVFAGLSLGPVIRVLPSDTGGINLLYSLLYYAVPLFNVLEHNVDRFILPSVFLLVLGASLVIGRSSFKVQLTWCLACLLEFILLSPAPWPVPTAPAQPHPISQRIQEMPAGAVIDIPYTYPNTRQAVGDVFFQQTVHQQPIPYRLEGIGPNMVVPVVRDNSFFERIHNLSQGEGTSEDAQCAGTSELISLGFEYVVLRAELYSERPESLIRTLSKCTTLKMESDSRYLFQLSDP